MNRVLSVSSLFIVFSFFITFLFAQPDAVILDNKEAFGGKQRPTVNFPHGLHMEGDMECRDCHHLYANGKNILDEDTLEEGRRGIKCADCHRSGKKYNLMQAFHTQCMGCHGKLARAGNKSGPVLCGECHPWK